MNKPDIKTSSFQEIADYAVQKIVEQGDRCLSEGDGFCAYGDGNGNHCAIGWLLDPDNMGIMTFSGGVYELNQVCGLELELEREVVLAQLQDFHDAADEVDRRYHLSNLEGYIDTSKPQYRQWVEMGEL